VPEGVCAPDCVALLVVLGVSERVSPPVMLGLCVGDGASDAVAEAVPVTLRV